MRFLLALLFLVQLHAEEPPKVREWLRLEVAEPQFTAAKLGLLETELDGVAKFLALHVYRKYAVQVGQGDLAAHALARRYLSLAMHLAPQNAEARAVNDWLLLPGRPEPPELPLTMDLFTDELQRLISRLEASPHQTDSIQQAMGYLAMAGADLAPQKEHLVLRAELFLRKFPSPSEAWRRLHQKTPKS
jgi:hypothetical protein